MIRGLFLYFLNLRPLALLLAGISASALIFAYVSQYVFLYDPCILCLYQRKPYFAVIALALGAAMIATRFPQLARRLLAGCVATFAVGAGIAFYHTGVEQSWWQGTAACGDATLPSAGDIEALRAYLEAKRITRCDVPSWTLFGLSMTVYNLILSLGLTAFSAAMLWMGRKKSA